MTVEIGEDGADHALGVDAPMLVKALVLDGDQRLAQLIGDAGERDARGLVGAQDRIDPGGQVVDRPAQQESECGHDPERGRDPEDDGDQRGNQLLPPRLPGAPHCG